VTSAKPKEYGITVHALLFATRDVGHVDAGRSKSAAPIPKVMECGVVKLPIAISVHVCP